MTDENNNQPINETSNNQAPETPVVTSEDPVNEQKNTTDTPEKTEPATTPEAPTSEAEQSSQNKNPVEKANANSEEKALIEYELPIRINQNTLVSDLNFVKNKKVVGEATFDGVKFESGTDLRNFTEIKFEKCDLSNMDVKLTPGCMIKIGKDCTFQKDENGQDIVPDGWRELDDNTYIYIDNNYENALNQVNSASDEELTSLMKEYGVEDLVFDIGSTQVITDDVVIEGQSLLDWLEVIHENQAVITGKTTFKDIANLSIIDLEAFQGNLCFKNCDLSDLANFEFKHGQKIEIDKECTLPDPLPAGWKKEKNTLIYEKPRTYEKSENNNRIEFDGESMDEFKFFTKDLHENNVYTDAPIVIKNVKLTGEIDLRNLKNVRFENCDLSDAKILIADDQRAETKITADADTKLPKKKKYKELIEQDPEEIKKEDEGKDKNANNKKINITEVELGKADYDGLKSQAELMGIRYGFGGLIGASNESSSSLNEGGPLYDFVCNYGEKQAKKIGKGVAKGSVKRFDVSLPGEEKIEKVKNWYKQTKFGSKTNAIVSNIYNKSDGVLKKFVRTRVGLNTYKTANFINKYVACGAVTSRVSNVCGNMLAVDWGEAAEFAKRQGRPIQSNLFQCTKFVMEGGKTFLKFSSKCMPFINVYMGGKGAINAFENGDVGIGLLKIVSTGLKFAGPLGNAAAFVIDVGIMVYEAYRKNEEKKAREEYLENLKKTNPEEYNFQMWRQEYLSKCVRSENGKKINDEDLKKLYEALTKLPPEQYDKFMNSQTSGDFNLEKILQEVEKLKNSGGNKRKSTGGGPKNKISAKSEEINNGQSGNPNNNTNNNKTKTKTNTNTVPNKLIDEVTDDILRRGKNSYYLRDAHNSTRIFMSTVNKNRLRDDVSFLLNHNIEYYGTCDSQSEFAKKVFQNTIMYEKNGEAWCAQRGEYLSIDVLTGKRTLIWGNEDDVKVNVMIKYFKEQGVKHDKIYPIVQAILAGEQKYTYVTKSGNKVVRKSATIPQEFKRHIEGAKNYLREIENPNFSKKALGYTSEARKDTSEVLKNQTGENVNLADDPTLYARGNYFTAYLDAREAGERFNKKVDESQKGTDQKQQNNTQMFNPLLDKNNIGRA